MADIPVIVHARHPSKIKRKPRDEAAPAVSRLLVVYATKPKRKFGIIVTRLRDQSQGEQ